MKTLKRVWIDGDNEICSKYISEPNDVYGNGLCNVYYYDEHGTLIPEDQAKQYLEVNNK